MRFLVILRRLHTKKLLTYLFTYIFLFYHNNVVKGVQPLQRKTALYYRYAILVEIRFYQLTQKNNLTIKHIF